MIASKTRLSFPPLSNLRASSSSRRRCPTMRALLEAVAIAASPLPILPEPVDAAPPTAGTPAGCRGFWYDLALALPSAAFVVFLLYQTRRNFAKLSHGRSYIMISYFALLWVVSLLNLAWCVWQAWRSSSSGQYTWNILSLFTSSGMLFMEISLISFLLQGNNHVTGLETLSRTFLISGVMVGLNFFLKAVCIFGFGVPLFVDADESSTRAKWALWIIHKLILTAVYGFLLFMHYTKWREWLPAKPAFYNYICVMFSFDAIALFACILVANGAGLGAWLYDLTILCYHALYLPFLYVIFLQDFFQEEDLLLENAYYSEMKDAGFFDEWDY